MQVLQKKSKQNLPFKLSECEAGEAYYPKGLYVTHELPDDKLGIQAKDGGRTGRK